jgi:hypothetical protein
VPSTYNDTAVSKFRGLGSSFPRLEIVHVTAAKSTAPDVEEGGRDEGTWRSMDVPGCARYLGAAGYNVILLITVTGTSARMRRERLKRRA